MTTFAEVDAAVERVREWLNAGAPAGRVMQGDEGDAFKRDLRAVFRLAIRQMRTERLARDSYVT